MDVDAPDPMDVDQAWPSSGAGQLQKEAMRCANMAKRQFALRGKLRGTPTLNLIRIEFRCAQVPFDDTPSCIFLAQGHHDLFFIGVGSGCSCGGATGT